jgi:hypothetical protein
MMKMWSIPSARNLTILPTAALRRGYMKSGKLVRCMIGRMAIEKQPGAANYQFRPHTERLVVTNARKQEAIAQSNAESDPSSAGLNWKEQRMTYTVI